MSQPMANDALSALGGVIGMTITRLRTGISRRAFIAASAGAVAVMALPSPLRAQDIPTLRIAVTGLTGEVLDPMMEVRQQVSDVGLLIFDSILEIGPNNELLAGLAEEWGVDESGTVWTFKLREGVQFHGGFGEVTAEDAVYTLQRWMHPDVSSSSAPPLRQFIESVAVLDTYRFEVRTKGQRPTLPFLLSPHESVAGIVLSKKHLMEAGDDFSAQTQLLNSRPIGSGVYQFDAHQRGQSLTLTAVEDHWRSKPEVRRVEFLIVPDKSTQFLMLQSGEVDMMQGSPDQAAQVETMDGVSLYSIASSADFGISFYGTYTDAGQAAPAGDPRVRRAISLAIDRQTINEALLGGRGKIPLAPWGISPTADGVKSEGLQAWLAEVASYDPAKAKALLAEAGYPDGFTISLRDNSRPSTFPNPSDTALAIASQLEAIGIKVEYSTQEYSTLRPYLVEKQGDPYIASQVSPQVAIPRFTAEAWLSTAFSQTGPSKLLNDTRFEELVSGVGQAMDPAAREELAMQAIKIISESWVSIPVLSADTLYLVSDSAIAHWHERTTWPYLSRQIELLKAAL